MRSGCGTRTSAAYESRERCEITNSSHDSSKRSSLRSPFLHVKKNSNGSVSLSTTLSESATADGSAGHERFNSQIYEGEWKNDKRHGYGTIRIIGSYTYYGQWVSNAQTGYGVMVYENGAKEEGQWQSGQLMVALKRKKIHLKTHQLEVRVQSAHTMAIQAANAARNKALLAQSRATSATAKSKMALVVAVTAEKEAVLAREKAELYKNTTKISGMHLVCLLLPSECARLSYQKLGLRSVLKHSHYTNKNVLKNEQNGLTFKNEGTRRTQPAR